MFSVFDAGGRRMRLEVLVVDGGEKWYVVEIPDRVLLSEAKTGGITAALAHPVNVRLLEVTCLEQERTRYST